MQPLTHDPLLWFGGRPEDDVVHLVRPPLYQVGGEEAPAWLADLPDRRTAYVTMGTAFNAVPRIFSVIVEALCTEDLNVIVTVGRGVDAAPLRVAPNIYVTDYIAQSAILPRADVVIQHSGYLTIVGALSHAVPMVLIPVAVDQPYHAHRLAAAGAAISLDAADLAAGPIRAAVRETLDNPLYRLNAARLQAEMSSMPSVERGVELLARLAATRQPVVASSPAPRPGAQESRVRAARGDGRVRS
jgi:MGT family glycosyltransferase